MKKKQLVSSLATAASLTQAQVTKVLDHLAEICESELKTNKMFILNDLVRLRIVDKPATPEREVKNPGTGKMMKVGPKPASQKLKVSAAKKLREIIKKPA